LTSKADDISDAADERPIRAKDLKSAAGMSYRQLNEWEAKGALPSQRDTAAWRRYTVTDAFVIAITKTVRDAFGTSLDSLSWLTRSLRDLPNDPLRWAVAKMRDHHMSLFLRTDLKSYVWLGTDIDLGDEFEAGAGRSEDIAPTILLQLNPIVNRVLRLTTTPDPLPITDEFYAEIEATRRMEVAQTLEEIHVLFLLRLKDVKSIKVIKKRDEIEAAEVEYQIQAQDQGATSQTVKQMLDELPWGEVSAKKADNGLTNITKKVQVRLLKNVNKEGRRVRIIFLSDK
jgi:DNA-binding transcriptional MerR regulator